MRGLHVLTMLCACAALESAAAQVPEPLAAPLPAPAPLAVPAPPAPPRRSHQRRPRRAAPRRGRAGSRTAATGATCESGTACDSGAPRLRRRRRRRRSRRGPAPRLRPRKRPLRRRLLRASGHRRARAGTAREHPGRRHHRRRGARPGRGEEAGEPDRRRSSERRWFDPTTPGTPASATRLNVDVRPSLQRNGHILTAHRRRIRQRQGAAGGAAAGAAAARARPIAPDFACREPQWRPHRDRRSGSPSAEIAPAPAAALPPPRVAPGARILCSLAEDPDRQPRRDRGADHPRLPRPRPRVGGGLLRRRSCRAPRPHGRRGRGHRPQPASRQLSPRRRAD